MCGNVAEWTRSTYQPRPGDSAADDSGDELPQAERVVRGGSWRSRPNDATAAHRWKYPAWRKVHDVGFRVTIEASEP